VCGGHAKKKGEYLFESNKSTMFDFLLILIESGGAFLYVVKSLNVLYVSFYKYSLICFLHIKKDL